MLEEDPDKLEDLGARPKKRPAPEPDKGEGGSMGPPPGKKPKKAKQAKTPKPKKDPKPKKPKKTKKSKKTAESSEQGETLQTGDPGQTPQMGEQDPTPGNAPGPMPPPRPGDTDPFEGKITPLRPEGEPTPLGTDPGQIDVRAIPLPPRPVPPLPPPCQPIPPLEPQPQPKPLMPPGRAMPLPTPGRRTPPGERQTHPPNENLKTRDIPLQADKEAETGMTALPLVVTEETVATKGKMVMERTMVMERIVVTEGTVVCQEHDWPDSSWNSLYLGGASPRGEPNRPTDQGKMGPLGTSHTKQKPIPRPRPYARRKREVSRHIRTPTKHTNE